MLYITSPWCLCCWLVVYSTSRSPLIWMALIWGKLRATMLPSVGRTTPQSDLQMARAQVARGQRSQVTTFLLGLRVCGRLLASAGVWHVRKRGVGWVGAPRVLLRGGFAGVRLRLQCGSNAYRSYCAPYVWRVLVGQGQNLSVVASVEHTGVRSLYCALRSARVNRRL